MRRRTDRRLLIATAACLAAAPPCAAQVDARLDAGVAVVKYEGFLTAAAASVTPSVTWQSPRTTLDARGTFLLFETGHTNLQASLSGTTFSPPLGSLRVEAAADAGASAYSAFARFAHAVGRVRLHVLGGQWGLWAGPLGGAVWSDQAAHGADGISVGWWARSAETSLAATWTAVAVGDTAYRDLQGRVGWRAVSGAFDVEAGVGTRFTTPGPPAHTYGDVSAVVRLTQWMELVAAAGSYASDPVRGTIASRFVTAGVRLTPRPRAAAVRQMAASVSPYAAEAPPSLTGARVSIEQADDRSILVVEAPGARLVEVMGDFTGWLPVALDASGAGLFRYALPLPAGVQRFNLRLDGGPWGVPQGVTVESDDFGGSVGVLVVP